MILAFGIGYLKTCFVGSRMKGHLVYLPDSRISHFKPSHCHDTIACRKNADKSTYLTLHRILRYISWANILVMLPLANCHYATMTLLKTTHVFSYTYNDLVENILLMVNMIKEEFPPLDGTSNTFSCFWRNGDPCCLKACATCC